MAKVVLEVIEGDHQGARFQFTQEGACMGRSSSNDIVLTHTSISRQQCHFRFDQNDRLHMINKSTSNITKVNNQAAEDMVLKNGDLIKTGIYLLRVSIEAPADRETLLVPDESAETMALPELSREMLAKTTPPRPMMPPAAPPVAMSPANVPATIKEGTLVSEYSENKAPSNNSPLVDMTSGSRDSKKTSDNLSTSIEATKELGHYNIEEKISDGAQAAVFRGRSKKTHEMVALKLFKIEGIDETASFRFKTEAEILGKLKHRNIVRYVNSFSVMDEWGVDCNVLVMEYLGGKNLKQVLADRPNGVPWKEASDIMDQCLHGLIYAQENHQITHRDIKPSNMIITDDGQVKLIDFGIARRNESSTFTGGGTMMGSFDYMSPDFVRVKEKGFRGDEVSDIFSLFVCFYHLITGSLPFATYGERPEIEFLNRWHNETPSISHNHVVFRIITHLSKFIDRGLALEREDRFQTFAEVLNELRGLKPRVVSYEGQARYEFVDALGKGGFSEVYKARRLSDGHVVAIKRLFADRPARRFIKEAHILSKFQHPYVVQYYDFFETDSSTGNKNYYLVMEYLPGIPGWTLFDRIKEAKSGLPVPEVLQHFCAYLSALAFLHANGIIHRDLKPANMYAPADLNFRSKLLDLGVAKDLSGTRTSGSIPGTCDYMAPEFVTGQSRGSPATDVYALGLSLFEALAGRPAYTRMPKQDRAIINELIRRARLPELDITFDHPVFTTECPELTPLVARSLAPNPKHRCGTASLLDSMAKILRNHYEIKLDADIMQGAAAQVEKGTSTSIVQFPASRAQRAEFTESLDASLPLKRGGKRRGLAKFIAFVLLLLLAFAGAYALLPPFKTKVDEFIAAVPGMLKQAGDIAGLRSKAPEPPPSDPVQVPGPDKSPDYPKGPGKGELVGKPPVKVVEPEPKPEPVQKTPVKTMVPEKDPVDQIDQQLKQQTESMIAAIKEKRYGTFPITTYDSFSANMVNQVTLLKNQYKNKIRTYPALAEYHEIQDELKRYFRSKATYILGEMDMRGIKWAEALKFLAMVRGLLYEDFMLTEQLSAKVANSQAIYRTVFNEWSHEQKGLDLNAFLPIRRERFFGLTKAGSSMTSTDFLDQVFSRKPHTLARILPAMTYLKIPRIGIDPDDPDNRRNSKLAYLPMVLVPDGRMKNIYVDTPFYMSQVETTIYAIRCYRDVASKDQRAEFFTGEIGYDIKGNNEEPFATATVDLAIEFCNWLSFRDELPYVYTRTGDHWTADLTMPGYRLPTMTEWEYATRFGMDFMGDAEAKTWDQAVNPRGDKRLAHYGDEAGDNPRPGGHAFATPLGLYDMCGNVWEITMDDRSVARRGTVDFVLQGGSIKSRIKQEVMPEYVKRRWEGDRTLEYIGFRVIRPVPIQRF